jgi:putative hydrolase of the HAD superfamily
MAITTIGFDADDTLWHSETHFTVTEQRFTDLLAPWLAPSEVADRLLRRERDNLRIFGYGVKGFTLSMIETAIEASAGSIDAVAINEIVRWGKEMLDHPVELLPGVEDTLAELDASGRRLLLITKGDLFHQESKIAESGLVDRFGAVEILSEKAPFSYRRVLDRHGIEVGQFAMVGNSVKSDVLPVLDIGGHAAHVPYHVTWSNEIAAEAGGVSGFRVLGSIREVPDWIADIESAGR